MNRKRGLANIGGSNAKYKIRRLQLIAYLSLSINVIAVIGLIALLIKNY